MFYELRFFWNSVNLEPFQLFSREISTELEDKPTVLVHEKLINGILQEDVVSIYIRSFWKLKPVGISYSLKKSVYLQSCFFSTTIPSSTVTTMQFVVTTTVFNGDNYKILQRIFSQIFNRFLISKRLEKRIENVIKIAIKLSKRESGHRPWPFSTIFAVIICSDDCDTN